MVEHRIRASPAQIKKLITGGAINLQSGNFDPSAKHMLMVMPNTSRRIGTAMRKGKGVRIMLKPDEDLMEEDMEGGKISIKRAARDVKKALTSRKAKNTYKAIGREVLPIAKGLADAGVDAGSLVLATYLGNPALAPVISGTAKVGLDLGYSALGREVGLDPDTPVPYLDSPEALQAAAMATAEKNIRTRTKGRVRDTGLAALSGDYDTAQRLGTEYVVDKKLSGVEKKIAKKAQLGQYKDIQDLATDYAAEKLAAATQVVPSNQDEIYSQSGRGISVRKTRGGLKIGGASPYLTSSYERAVTCGSGLSGQASASYDMRGVVPATAPSSITQLGSPYQRIQSPSMSPFYAASPQLVNKPISGNGFNPAGRSGKGFNPAG